VWFERGDEGDEEEEEGSSKEEEVRPPFGHDWGVSNHPLFGFLAERRTVEEESNSKRPDAALSTPPCF
jgi:hypothetical protein